MDNSGSTALGVDIGGTNTKVGLVDINGEVSLFNSFPTQAQGKDPNPFLMQLRDIIHEILDSTLTKVNGIGISTHGYIDDERHGPIISESTPAIRGIDLHGMLHSEFNLPVKVSNDLAAHAMAEYYFGCGRGTRRFMTMAVGTGIGVGVVIDGKPLRFVGGTTGDTGRIILQPGGPKCSYNVSGSAEALCGTANIERQAVLYYGEKVPAYQVIKAARDGTDLIAIDIIQQIGYYLGWVIASLSAIFLPEKVALTGGTSEAGYVLLEACRKRFEEMVGDYHITLARLSGGYHKGVEIVLSQYREESGVVGAVVELLLPRINTLLEEDH